MEHVVKDAKTGNVVTIPFTPEEEAAWVASQPDQKTTLREYAANKRWQVEIGGVAWDGHVVATDRESQTKLLAEFVAIGAGLRTDPSPWKFNDNYFPSLSNAEMASVIQAARSHIAAAFAVEKTLLAAIESGVITHTFQIDGANWPNPGF